MICFSHFPIKRSVSLLLTALLLLTGCQIQVGYMDSDTDSVTSSHTAPPTTEALSATVVTTTKAPATTTLPTPTVTTPAVTTPAVTTPIVSETVTQPVPPTTEAPVVPTKRVAFTFDDGPHPTLTYKFVDKLKEYGAAATFFVVGNTISKSRGAAMAYAAENGCEIGIHSYTHTKALYYHTCTEAEYLQDMQQCADAIAKYVSDPIRLMRPPGGNITADRVKKCPYGVILWNVDSNDWRYKARTDEATIQQNINIIVDNVMKDISDGDIILMHEIYENTYEAFCILIERLYQEGYELVTVSELLGDDLRPGQKYYSH